MNFWAIVFPFFYISMDIILKLRRKKKKQDYAETDGIILFF